jgi:hypothetical protein
VVTGSSFLPFYDGSDLAGHVGAIVKKPALRAPMKVLKTRHRLAVIRGGEPMP